MNPYKRLTDEEVASIPLLLSSIVKAGVPIGYGGHPACCDLHDLTRYALFEEFVELKKWKRDIDKVIADYESRITAILEREKQLRSENYDLRSRIESDAPWTAARATTTPVDRFNALIVATCRALDYLKQTLVTRPVFDDKVSKSLDGRFTTMQRKLQEYSIGVTVDE